MTCTMSDEQQQRRAADLTAALGRPPANMAIVLLWAQDLGLDPEEATWNAARDLPPASTLRAVLRALGATDAAIQEHVANPR